ncbi:ABC transporter permease [Capnocytophaga stomatis]|uniref:ABC transporter permease n=1 Tax=Capnocytophaga stomatis TaxID=1848904 RepID=A0A250FVX1_9FLAO|nr:ABC transporter permease [Capnocytophaga stomatis]ATA89309.1 ABC transporter permease [Capnocytophaga stomatis]
MLLKLQKSTLVKSQIIGYALTLFVGVVIVLITIQLYFDVRPLLEQQSDVFKNQTVVISKNVSIFKSTNKDRIYFTENDIQELQKQDFISDVAAFNNASFKIGAFTKQTNELPRFYTDLFFESIPDKYLDVQPEEWQWDVSQDFVPIIIPENYLSLYNFGFAESQGLPVLSKNMISQIQFNIEVEGNGRTKHFESKIVGFSNKINSILVPDEFLRWANVEFGRGDGDKINRLLIDFKNPSDERILQFFNENNYSINKDELEFGKMVFFFKTALFFVFFIASIIVVLSVAFILLSVNLIIQKNKELLLNLYQIGYSHLRIAKFYGVVISVITLLSVVFAVWVSNSVRKLYLAKLKNFFDFSLQPNEIYFVSFSLLILLIFIYNVLLIKNVKKAVGA